MTVPPEDDDAPTDYRPTELGAAIDETEAHKAWALAEEPDDLPWRFTPGRITALAVAGSLVLIGVAAGISVWHLRDEPDAPVGVATSPPSVAAPPEPTPEPEPRESSPNPAPTKVTPSTTAPAAVALPLQPNGTTMTALIITRSGKTACQVDVGVVGCQAPFTFSTPTSECGDPSTIISVRANGSRRWGCGNLRGMRTFTTISYGTTYSALGWTITATSIVVDESSPFAKLW